MLKNRDAVIEKLAGLMCELDIERNPLQVDIYLYIDEEGNCSFKKFFNAGGSWLDDDHIVIYSCGRYPHDYDDVFHEYNIDDLCDVLEMSLDELKARTAEFIEYGIEDVADYDIHYYIQENSELLNKVLEDHNKRLWEECKDYYSNMAQRAIEDFEYYEENK